MDNFLTYSTELLLLLLIIITFLQSAFDKLLDWKGNLSWLTGHFEKTPFKNIVPFLLGTVLLTEMAAGILSAVGFFMICIKGETIIALAGAIVACLALLMLLFGQRMSKDYDGARTIVIYFIPAIFLVFLLH